MTIRIATLSDLPGLIAMGRAQLAATYGDTVPPDAAGVEAVLITLVTGAASVVFVAEQAGAVVGMIGLVRYPHPMSGVVTAGEVTWWVDPAARGSGLALLRRAERWAAETGAAAIQMIAPATNARVGRIYERRGYAALETSYQAPVTAAMSALTVVDDVLPDFPAYVAATRAQPVGDVETGPGVVFHGIARPVDDTLVRWVTARWPSLTPRLSFVRQSPAGQVEPNHIHTDRDMSTGWTGIHYLTPNPPADDGTTFWRWRETGQIQSTATDGEALLGEWLAWRDPAQWVPWHTVAARPNRLVLFPVAYFHSRAIRDNYGAGDTARLIHVTFFDGTLA